MNESLPEKLSLLIDDQLEASQAFSLLKTAKQDAELQAKLRRYALISQAMKTEQYSVASLDFADKIHQRIKLEPTYLLPVTKKTNRYNKAALAVAASVVLAVVGLSVSKLQLQNAPQTGAISVAQRSTQAERSNAQFKEYLQAHDNVWYVNNTVGNQSQVRMVSYQHK
jgi:sigma-E factor negative regulatory protein RseA